MLQASVRCMWYVRPALCFIVSCLCCFTGRAVVDVAPQLFARICGDQMSAYIYAEEIIASPLIGMTKYIHSAYADFFLVRLKRSFTKYFALYRLACVCIVMIYQPVCVLGAAFCL